MMLRTIFILILSSYSLLTAQSLNIEYEYLDKTEYPASYFDGISDVDKKKIVEDIKKPQIQNLYYNNGDSFYTNHDTKSIEIINDSREEGNTQYIKSSVIPSKKVRYYRYKNKKGVFIYYFFKPNYEFYFLANPTWKIEYKNDKLKIDNFTCNLAELTQMDGKIVKVWYTEEIPVQAGPLRYYNFPGLVLKVEAPTFVVYATKIAKTVKETDIEKVDPKLKVYDNDDDYLKKIKEIREENSKNKNIKL